MTEQTFRLVDGSMATEVAIEGEVVRGVRQLGDGRQLRFLTTLANWHKVVDAGVQVQPPGAARPKG